MIRAFYCFFMIMQAVLVARIETLKIARDWHERKYLPALQGKILYVGVGQYTQKYHRLTKSPKSFETIDFLPERAHWGSPYGHYVEDFLTFDPGYQYDHISMFGIMGHPESIYCSIVDDETITESLNKADALLKVGGTLELGPNHAAVAEQHKDFWLERFAMPPLDKYKVLYIGVGVDNIVWWGKKVKE